MIKISEALDTILSAVPIGLPEEVPIGDAVGRSLAAAVFAHADVPPFANSQMDGVAVRAGDLAGASAAAPVRLPCRGTVAAGGGAPAALEAGTTVRIMTGAPIPPGADAVVPVEDIADHGAEVGFSDAPSVGRFVRLAGEDLRAGEEVLAPGTLIGPAHVGLLASLGRPIVTVTARPRVAVISTGDELVPLGHPLGPGEIYNSNAYTLAAATRAAGGAPTTFSIVGDDRAAIESALQAASTFDVILTTGGVSVGDFDFVKEIMDEMGLKRRFWKVAQKPGKPITFAERDGRLHFGLPGNPVSALMCFVLYVAPCLRRAGGRSDVFLPALTVRMADSVRTARDLTELVRCRLEPDGDGWIARSTGTQSSGALHSLAHADALVISPPGTSELPEGEAFRAVRLHGEPLVDSHPFP